MKANLSISRAATWLGVHPATLRRLERAGKIKPHRDANGWRRFTAEDMEAAQRALGFPALRGSSSIAESLRAKLGEMERQMKDGQFDAQLSREIDTLISQIEAHRGR